MDVQTLKINTPLGDRMKKYERCSSHYLMPHMPTIIRVDGKTFHSFTRKIGAKKPFDQSLRRIFLKTMEMLFDNIQNAAFAYHQSDEISILLKDWPDLNTEQWFGGNIQKIASVSASMATAFFNPQFPVTQVAMFDARVFQLPPMEVVNYFIWRQKDWERNSLQMLARSCFSQKQLHKKSSAEIHDMLHSLDVNWNDCETWEKSGTVIRRYCEDDVYHQIADPGSIIIENETPIFSQYRPYIEQYL